MASDVDVDRMDHSDDNDNHHVPQCSSINGYPCMIMRSQPLVVILVLSARCIECKRGQAMRILSVRSSVTRVNCDETVKRAVQIFILYKDHLA